MLVEAIMKQNKELVQAVLALDVLDPRTGGQEGSPIEFAQRLSGEKAQEIASLLSSTLSPFAHLIHPNTTCSPR